MLFQRVFYAIREFFKNYSSLKNNKKILKIGSLLDLNSTDLENLHEKGLKILVLDFDGVLASHGEFEPEIQIQEWLRIATKIFGLGSIFILTNNPKPERESFFKQHFPEIKFVCAPRKKPYPDGLLLIQQSTQALPSEIALVDDRLLTGMLACQLAGVGGFWVMRPYANFSKRPLKELGFALLRWLEKRLY